MAWCLHEQPYVHYSSQDAIFQECLVFVRSAEDVEEEELDGGIRRQWLSQFEFMKLFTASPEPQFISWLRLWYRLPTMEKGIREVVVEGGGEEGGGGREGGLVKDYSAVVTEDWQTLFVNVITLCGVYMVRYALLIATVVTHTHTHTHTHTVVHPVRCVICTRKPIVCFR